jgi:hypothetical protein
MAITAALFFIGLAGYAVWAWTTARELDETVAELRRAGEPLTLADLAAGPRDDACGRLYARLFDVFAAAPPIDEPSPPAEAPSPAQARPTDPDAAAEPAADPPVPLTDTVPGLDRPAVRRWVEAHGSLFEQLQQAAAMEACRFDWPLEHGADALVERMQAVGRTVRYQSVRVAMLLDQGRADAAADAVAATLALARIYAHEPTVATLMQRYAVLEVAVGQVEMLLERRAGLSADAAARLQAALRRAQRADLLAHALRVERVLGWERWRGVFDPEAVRDNAGPTLPREEQYLDQISSTPVTRKMAASFLQESSRLIELAERPWPERRGAIGAAEAGLTAQGIARQVYKVTIARGRVLALLRAAEIALAAELHRRQAGQLPETSPLDRPDPFADGPMHYRRLHDGGCVIYSVGENEADDGGQVRPDADGRVPDWGLRITPSDDGP